jgi:hypothetical protein
MTVNIITMAAYPVGGLAKRVPQGTDWKNRNVLYVDYGIYT